MAPEQGGTRSAQDWAVDSEPGHLAKCGCVEAGVTTVGV